MSSRLPLPPCTIHLAGFQQRLRFLKNSCNLRPLMVEWIVCQTITITVKQNQKNNLIALDRCVSCIIDIIALE